MSVIINKAETTDTVSVTVPTFSPEEVVVDALRSTKTTLSKFYRKVHNIVWRVVKRSFDILFSGIMLIMLAPVFVVVAVLIKLDDGGPVFFHQVRTGRKGKTFKIVKFRTCRVDNDVHDAKSADAHTKIGNLLRKTSIDELPQLWNIFKGEMSFVGPRPWITDYYENMTAAQRERTSVRPGMTGLAQVNGRNALSIFDKIGYDLEYVDRYGLREDVKVFTLTVKSLLGKGNNSAVDAGKSTIHNELEQLRIQHNQ
ncbi:MAG: sugar transferase [Candidatus Saccharibacteria bacterium]|nr:sugar transferase [Candidatus Saccharibacteria bacterium]